ncbi:MAG: EamA family transporter [Thermomicrobiales bacterium]|nr:EamA family transporter [Thermomicrobiales bacterium]
MSDDPGSAGAPTGSRTISNYFNPRALSAIMMWGAIAPFTKYALGEIPPLSFMALRMSIAAVIVFAYMRLRRLPVGIEREDVPKFLLAGSGFFALSTLLFTTGLSRTTVAHMVILASIGPLLGAVYRWLGQGDRPDRRSMVAMLIGFAGVLIVVGDASSAEGASVVGDVMGLASSALWVGMSVYPQPLVKKYGALRSTGWFIAMALLLIVPLSLPSLGSLAGNMPQPLVGGALIYVAMGTLVGNTLWQAAVQQVGPARTLVYMYLQPFCSLLIAAIILGDRLTPEQVIGGLLAIGGVMLVKKR